MEIRHHAGDDPELISWKYEEIRLVRARSYDSVLGCRGFQGAYTRCADGYYSTMLFQRRVHHVSRRVRNLVPFGFHPVQANIFVSYRKKRSRPHMKNERRYDDALISKGREQLWRKMESRGRRGHCARDS